MPIYYVAKTGSDSQNGSAGSPFLTVLHGLGVLVAGDTLYVRPGIYAESLFDAIPTGNPSQAVTLAQDPLTSGDVVTLRPNSGFRVLSFGTPVQYITVSKIICDGVNVSIDCVKITTGANHITLADCEIKNAPGVGQLAQGLLISGDGSDFNQILRCRIHDNGNDGLAHQLYLQTSDNLIEGCEIYGGLGYGVHEIAGSCARNVYRYNKIHDILANPGILLASGHDNQVYYNLFYNCQLGIQVSAAESTSVLYNNTIYAGAVGIGGIHMEGRITPIVGNIVRNNICWGHSAFDYRDNDSTGTVVDHNLFGIMQPESGGNLIGIDPLFFNPGILNFRLQASSAGINAGLNVELTLDYDGKVVPQGSLPDLGAFELGGIPVAPTNLRRVLP